MSCYAFVILPFKTTQKAGRNTQLDTSTIPRKDLEDVEKLRATHADVLETVRKNLNGRKTCEAMFAAEKDRGKWVCDLIHTADAYVRALFSAVKRFPVVGTMYYYYWSSSLTDAQFIGYDDFRYDAAALYYNIAVCLMNLAQYLMSVRATVGTMKSLETESYRMLLRAAGYFSLCKTLTQAMRAAPIAVAPQPVPPDTANAVLSLLDGIAVAQAQEIGVSRAIAADEKIEKAQTVMLCHQLYLLYEGCKSTAQSMSCSHSADYAKISLAMAVKSDIARALLYGHAAAYAFVKTPADGMRLLEDAKQHGAVVLQYYQKYKKLGIPFDMEALVEKTVVTLRRSEERLTKINAMVHHAKPAQGVVALPAAQVLAQRTDVELPLPLPDAAPPPPPPPPPPPATPSS